MLWASVAGEWLAQPVSQPRLRQTAAAASCNVGPAAASCNAGPGSQHQLPQTWAVWQPEPLNAATAEEHADFD